MTRRDYRAIAGVIAGEVALARDQSPVLDVLRNVTRSVADVCAQDNCRFKRDTFYRACGFDELAAN
jgi:hypothetical protein